ncbi:MAG: response regulator transcription factor [Candidatus Dormibacteraeota bacterium]|nr:response regulator transcription factor [Candidatus Dormibacteraeota bacterium]
MVSTHSAARVDAPVAEAAAPILVVDDDPKIVSLVRAYLEREGFRVNQAGDGETAIRAVHDSAPKLVVLDVMLPEVDGFTVLRRIRETSAVPVVMLSARGLVTDRVFGLSEGADDYLAKPFSPAELVVRIKAVLRRTLARPSRRAPGVLRDVVVDFDRFAVTRAGKPVALTATEFRILAALVAAGGRVLSRQALLDAMYGDAPGDAFERTVDVHVGRLREKLGDASSSSRYVMTVRGAGYRACVS